MVDRTDAEFEELAARLVDPATTLPAPKNVSSGPVAAAAGRKFLIAEYGSKEELDVALRTSGRPRLGQVPKGASPAVRGRVPAADRAAFDQLIAATGKNESELVREAVHLLFEQYKIAS